MMVGERDCIPFHGIPFRSILPSLVRCCRHCSSELLVVIGVHLCSSLIGSVGADSVGSVFPADDFVAPVSNLVAKGLHGQDREGFFHLRGQLLDSKEQETEHRHGGQHSNVVPHVSKGFPQRKGQQEQPHRQESGRVSVVNQGHRRGQQALAGSQIVLKDRQGPVHLVLSHKVHGQVLDRQTEIVQRPVGTVGGLDDGLGLCLWQAFVELGLEGVLVLGFGAEVAFHGSDKGPGAQTEAFQVGLPLRIGYSGLVVVGLAQSDQIAGVVDVFSPVLSGFVPSLVGSIGSENEQQSQRRTR
mmetsp:Transcript_22030/g.47897  ORF Transcript_22030/g.47897 Transcript_22030/m.47897 type:complete len:299 (+) Transcript_22030:400-1296(+)